MNKSVNIKLMLFITVILISFQISSAQVTQEWVSRYSGPGNKNEKATSMKADKSGNTYLTGSCFRNDSVVAWCTIKYNSSGIMEWVSFRNSPTQEAALAIAISDSANVYITGRSINQFLTIKYNLTGEFVWESIFNGNVSSADAIAVDDFGNVYVTGWSNNGSTTIYLTLKYNSNGIAVWSATYTEIQSSNSKAKSIAVDNTGNVYVTGVSNILSGTGNDYATIKYNSSGVQQWVARYNGLGNGTDEAISISTDSSNNVYVTGRSVGSGTNYDYATIKYDSSGNQLWVTRYNGEENYVDEAYSLTNDNSGNVYVTGASFGNGSDFDYATIKYNIAGEQQWSVRYNGSNYQDIANSIVVDDSKNVYVTGSSFDLLTGYDYATIKYNSSGVQQWAERYNGLANGSDKPTSIGLDSSGNVYVSGNSIGIGTGNDFAIVKYSQSVGIYQTSAEIPKLFSLFQNYPNPFNPVTNLEFGIPASRGESDWGFVTLKIYNMLGKEVAIILNENLNPGTYKYLFDGSNLPSGLYFYSLTAVGYTETKKMLLLK